MALLAVASTMSPGSMSLSVMFVPLQASHRYHDVSMPFNADR
jgi:hypothetical protein